MVKHFTTFQQGLRRLPQQLFHKLSSSPQNSKFKAPPKTSEGDMGLCKVVENHRDVVALGDDNTVAAPSREDHSVEQGTESLAMAGDMENASAKNVAAESVIRVHSDEPSETLNASKPSIGKRVSTRQQEQQHQQLRVVDHCEETGQTFFEVERIVDVRPTDDWEVQIKWVGWSDMTWEPFTNLITVESIEEAIQKINEKRKNKTPDSEMKLRDRVFVNREEATGNDDEASTGSVYAVEHINDVRIADSWEVKIKWVGAKETTWEPLEYLNNEDLEEEARRKIEMKKGGTGNCKKVKRSPARGSQDQHRAAKRQRKKRSPASKQSAKGQTSKREGLIHPALSFGGHQLGDVTLISPKKKKKATLLSHYFGGDRLLTFTKQLGKDDLPGQGVAMFNGTLLVLVAVKEINDNSGFNLFSKQKQMRYVYVAADNGVEAIQRKLEEVADYRSLPVHKRIARLEHLMTDGTVFDNLSVDDFEKIDEAGHDGCGFIPAELLRQMYPRRPWVSAIQVRCAIPELGFAKGMLVVKHGISKIQVPSSMLKVLPPENKTGKPVLLVRGEFPSYVNRCLGALMDTKNGPKKQSPPSFGKNIKPLSTMYSYLLEGLGVPARTMEEYARAACTKGNLEHANLVGVTDPTGRIPTGKIFITGPKRNLAGEGQEMLISRSPCLEPSDMKLLPLCEKEEDLLLPDTTAAGIASRNEAWSQLCNLPFGLVVFPLNQALQTQIAEGDLDGDLYIVFWSSKILSNIRKTKDLCCDINRPPAKPNTLQRSHSDTSPNWLEETQIEMLNCETVKLKSELIGSLYNKCHGVGKLSKQHIYDKDARAYARACKDSIDSGKHDCKVRLPTRLHSQLKEHLQPLLTDCAVMEGKK